MLRDENTDADGMCDDGRIYYLGHANFNITTLVDTAGDPLDRYVYSPYGALAIYDASWSNIRAASSHDVAYTYTGKRFDPETELYYYRHRNYHAELGRFLARDFIGFEGSEWNLYEYAASAPTVHVDPTGLACWLCTTLQSVTDEKDAKGNVIGCVLKYKFDPKVQTRVIAGKSCPKECEPVADCLDIPNLKEMTVLKLGLPKKKGFPGFGKAYCPPATDWNQKYCFAVHAKNCQSDWLKEFKDCTDLCKKGEPAKYLCKAIKVPGLKQLCEAMVKGSVSNCIYYCESLGMKRVDD